MTYKVLAVSHAVLFSNQFLEDLDKIWELRHWIPDPTKRPPLLCRQPPQQWQQHQDCRQHPWS